MGLDALVYRNKANLPFDADAVGAEFNSITGEYYFADDAVEQRYPYETRVAISKSIGNITLVGRLREEAQAVLERQIQLGAGPQHLEHVDGRQLAEDAESHGRITSAGVRCS